MRGDGLRLQSSLWPILAVLLWIPAFSVPLYLSRYGHNPPVGVYVAIMGVAAAAATFRKEPTLKEKAAWIILITLLMYAEIKGLYYDQKVRDDAFNQTMSKLGEIQLAQNSLVSVTNQLANVPPPSGHTSIMFRSQPLKDLKERTLLLAKDVLAALTVSLHKYASPTNPRIWSDFVDQFGVRYSGITDELAAAGLGDLRLPPHISELHASGNIAEIVREIADRLSGLSSLLPPDGMYKGLSNAKLGEAMIAKATELNDMSQNMLQKLEENAQLQADRDPRETNPNFIRYDLYWDFARCCREAVKDLRGVALQRLPGAVNQSETEAFLSLMRMTGTDSYDPIHEYAPYLKSLGERLKAQK